ncbi:nutrient deprivation-induced protein [Devosia pacifica]|uniref:Nutrient deprivation-induced protein n=1 Tax=Devosia pacifica TaxID=1335967 RepID=A0A918SF70_9HYPH|nr:phage holin family protein [Devosia pacifica]GHA36030.1 nutrient deprivation-induced protein [Devosia pacifica]
MDTRADPQNQESLPHLVRGLIDDITGLFRKEVNLAKAELNEKTAYAAEGGRMIAIGAVLGIGALGVLLAAIVTIIGAALTAMGMSPLVANSISGLIVAIVVGLIAMSMVRAGMKSMKRASFDMHRTTDALGHDAAAVKERF